MKNQIIAITLISYCLSGCSAGLADREKIITGAEEIAAGPDFPHSKGGSGSSKGDHYVYRGSFLVTFDQYRSENLGKDAFCWDVFQKYGPFIRKKIDLDSIPEMIGKGGSSQYDPKNTRYDYTFAAKDVSVIYDAEWFRGGPKDPDRPNPEIQIRYHIRIN